MGKNKLAKFADMKLYAHVFEPECRYDSDTEFALRGNWRSSFFHNNNPIVVELGCGRGEYTVGLAELYPDKNFIGVDIKGSRMWSGATRSLEMGLKNVAFLRCNIEMIERFFVAGEIDEIWLTFPDPQMKKATKRLTSTWFLKRYRNIMVDNGIIHLKSDSNFMYIYTKLNVEHNGLPVEYQTDNLYNEESRDYILSIRTYYEEQWLARGMSIKYIQFRLPTEGELTEPDVEIELDDYRSYGRGKRSSLTTSR